ncbi:hypothetical protein TIFTF001_007590 [Ficus carica]|uniref:Uncharacterized protein n=1 Tax=Ficus carica TaxID=3494 RepID=A0AA88D112_FICCA|nr:hypothetical protein TIFTF001_007590 [Ficus carica]
MAVGKVFEAQVPIESKMVVGILAFFLQCSELMLLGNHDFPLEDLKERPPSKCRSQTNTRIVTVMAIKCAKIVTGVAEILLLRPLGAMPIAYSRVYFSNATSSDMYIGRSFVLEQRGLQEERGQT